MQTVFHRALVLQAVSGLVLVIAASAVFSSNSFDSWTALTALLVHFGGLVLLYSAVRVWMVRFGGRKLLVGDGQRSVTSGCLLALVRFVLIMAIVAASGIWLWFSAVDLNEIRMLVTDGRPGRATVVGRDIMPAKAPVGYVNYSYRVTPTVAPVGKFAVVARDIPSYWTGRQIDITYAAPAPSVHRLGRVDWLYGLRRLCYWLLLLANGEAYLFLPLWLLEFRRGKTGVNLPEGGRQ